MRMFQKLTMALVLVPLLVSCTGPAGPEQGTASVNPVGAGLVADQIVYDVIIKNPDPQDEWTEKCLEGLNRRELVDFILAVTSDSKTEILIFKS